MRAHPFTLDGISVRGRGMNTHPVTSDGRQPRIQGFRSVRGASPQVSSLTPEHVAANKRAPRPAPRAPPRAPRPAPAPRAPAVESADIVISVGFAEASIEERCRVVTDGGADKTRHAATLGRSGRGNIGAWSSARRFRLRAARGGARDRPKPEDEHPTSDGHESKASAASAAKVPDTILPVSPTPGSSTSSRAGAPRRRAMQLRSAVAALQLPISHGSRSEWHRSTSSRPSELSRHGHNSPPHRRPRPGSVLGPTRSLRPWSAPLAPGTTAFAARDHPLRLTKLTPPLRARSSIMSAFGRPWTRVRGVARRSHATGMLPPRSLRPRPRGALGAGHYFRADPHPGTDRSQYVISPCRANPRRATMGAEVSPRAYRPTSRSPSARARSIRAQSTAR
jgi:hypothetical protein